MILSSGFQSFRRIIRSRFEFWNIERLKEILSAVEYSDVRTIKFVGRQREEITTDLLHIDQFMSRVVNSINETKSARIASHCTDHFEVIDRSEDIRRRADRDESGLFTEQRRKSVHLELAGLDIHR